MGVLAALLLLSGALPVMAAAMVCAPHACCAPAATVIAKPACCEAILCAAPAPQSEQATAPSIVQLVAIQAQVETTVTAAVHAAEQSDPPLHPKAARLRLAELSLLRI
ncbi:MAG TPA: hypothetical protein VGF69_05520 [Thermoanaerobaculia bacterium]|jgi:hypothetical protein